MGLRAFSSQLLCEQVVGRGLRRTSYEVNPDTGLFEPEYVNIFVSRSRSSRAKAVMARLLPRRRPRHSSNRSRRNAVSKSTWPNVVRVDHVYTPVLQLNVDRVPLLKIDATQTATLAELAPIIDGKADPTKVTEIALADLDASFVYRRLPLRPRPRCST